MQSAYISAMAQPDQPAAATYEWWHHGARVPFTPPRRGRQRCRSDSRWYNCLDKRCSLTRPCASNPGLLHCACPTLEPRFATSTDKMDWDAEWSRRQYRLAYDDRSGLQKCEADQTLYNCQDSRCGSTRPCGSNAGLLNCACPAPSAPRTPPVPRMTPSPNGTDACVPRVDLLMTTFGRHVEVNLSSVRSRELQSALAANLRNPYLTYVHVLHEGAR